MNSEENLISRLIDFRDHLLEYSDSEYSYSLLTKAIDEIQRGTQEERGVSDE